MKTCASRVAGLILSVAVGSVVAVAGDAKEIVSYSGTCLAPIAVYKDGMQAVPGAEAMAPTERLIKVTNNFRAAIGAFREVQACHSDLYKQSGASEEFAALYAGTREASRVFSLLQAEFEEAVEAISGEALASVEPASGEGTEANLAAEEATFSTMEVLMDSYMALEFSREFGKSLEDVSS